MSRRYFLSSVAALGFASYSQGRSHTQVAGSPSAVDLTAGPVPISLQGQTASVYGYGGRVPGPALEFRPGDRVRIRLHNRLGLATNLHFHGLHVTPTGSGDNPFVEVLPGDSHEYDFVLPSDHPAGLFWYHAHVHGSVADQVGAGLAGPLIVRGDLDAVPEIAAAREEILVLQDFDLDRRGMLRSPSMMSRMMGREGAVITVNGQLRPDFRLRRGELMRLRLLNASPSRFYRLQMEDHAMRVIAWDGLTIFDGAARAMDSLLLAPGQRAEVLVEGSRPDGTYTLWALPHDRGGMGMMGMGMGMGMGMMRSRSGSEPMPLATWTYAGTAPRVQPLPDRIPSWNPVLGVVSRHRRLVLGESHMAFTIDGRTFDHHRLDQLSRVGSTEEWEIVNEGNMDHPFHIHTNPFFVVEEGVWRDTVVVPRRGSVRLRMQFADFTGTTMYHCHILDHEDLGMMGTLRIQ